MNVPDPVETTIITREEWEANDSGMYLVETNVPLMYNPKKNVYHMTQDDLDNFLDGYNEYAEFIVSIKFMG